MNAAKNGMASNFFFFSQIHDQLISYFIQNLEVGGWLLVDKVTNEKRIMKSNKSRSNGLKDL